MAKGLTKEYRIIPPAIATAGVYYFTTDKDAQYEVRFGRRQDNILHATIVFGVINDEYEGEEYVETNDGDLYRVMATIVQVVRIFMTQHPKMVTYEFTGIAKESENEASNLIQTLAPFVSSLKSTEHKAGLIFVFLFFYDQTAVHARRTSLNPPICFI